MHTFFDFLCEGGFNGDIKTSKPQRPSELKPLHVELFITWLKDQAKRNGWGRQTARVKFTSAKATLLAMFDLGLIQGEPIRYFRKGAFEPDAPVGATSLSDGEQERLAAAVKADLSAIHHGRLKVTMRELQALRALVIAHRAGHNATPLLEIKRDAVVAGLVPGTVLVKTEKYRGRRQGSQAAVADDPTTGKDYLPFSLAEAAVIKQAIESTADLVERAPAHLRNRVWLYEVAHNTGRTKKGAVSVLTAYTMIVSIKSLIARHDLKGDDGKPLVVNTTRLRKARFDRAFRLTDGDIILTANLMGNTPRIAAANYPSMNASMRFTAANFLNDSYVDMLRRPPEGAIVESTPVAGCSNSRQGEFAPRDGSLCDRFVMCVFCADFAIVGTVDELWKLYSFQSFAKAELDFLKQYKEDQKDTSEGKPVDLQELYEIAIPFIDSFTERHFAASRIREARLKTEIALHPFWRLQISRSSEARRVLGRNAD